VVKLVTAVSDLTPGYGGSYRSGPAPPEGHFIILPTPDCCLLVKSLAVSELMVSADLQPIDQHSQNCLDNMSAVLGNVLQAVCLYDLYKNPLATFPIGSLI